MLKARIITAFQLFCYFAFFVLYNYRRKFFVNLCNDYSSGWAAFTFHIFHFHFNIYEQRHGCLLKKVTWKDVFPGIRAIEWEKTVIHAALKKSEY